MANVELQYVCLGLYHAQPLRLANFFSGSHSIGVTVVCVVGSARAFGFASDDFAVVLVLSVHWMFFYDTDTCTAIGAALCVSFCSSAIDVRRSSRSVTQ